jgi:hypothetical protein
MLAETLDFVFSLLGASILGLVGLAAIAIGAVRAIVDGVDMANDRGWQTKATSRKFL